MVKAVTRARVATATVAERVERIAEMMRQDEWVRGQSAAPLADEWGVAVNTVEQLASEASRIIAREVTDPMKLKEDVSVILVENLRRASKDREYRAVASLGDVVTKIAGARAPEKHQHAHVVATYEQLDAPSRLAQLDDAIATLTAERDALRSELALETKTRPGASSGRHDAVTEYVTPGTADGGDDR